MTVYCYGCSSTVDSFYNDEDRCKYCCYKRQLRLIERYKRRYHDCVFNINLVDMSIKYKIKCVCGIDLQWISDVHLHLLASDRIKLRCSQCDPSTSNTRYTYKGTPKGFNYWDVAMNYKNKQIDPSTCCLKYIWGDDIWIINKMKIFRISRHAWVTITEPIRFDYTCPCVRCM